jgi:nucleoside-diphosphate-sugar epimerase
MKLAVTGGTGFVGGHLLDAAIAAGHQVRALTRREQAPRDGVEWVSGDLQDRTALEALVTDADAVIHAAGVISAPTAAGFELGNVAGTLSMLAAATAGGVRRFVHVSSLAAREPGLSLYGASKARSEALVRESGLDCAIVRPPAVYGPGDRETLDLFRMAERGLVLLPPEGRLSLIHADDLARLLIALATAKKPPPLTEPDDGKPGGWSHRELAAALGEAVGRKGVAVSMPRAALRLGAVLDRMIRRDRAKLTPDRAAYFCHPDWVASPGLAPPPEIWAPAIDTRQGLRATREWYQAHRLLRPS